MLILAFDSSAKSASVALMRNGALIAQYSQSCGLTHSSTLLPMAEDLLKNTAIPLTDVDLFAVSHGPGSFTGIRIGVAIVKGLAWASEKPCTGVSTLEAMAWNGLVYGEGALICCAMDARRGQIYNALFEIRDGAPRRLVPDRAISLYDLAAELHEKTRSIFTIGDGAELCAAALAAEKLPSILAPEPLRLQSAWGVCMAASEKLPGTADELTPTYLRPSQAERELSEKLQADWSR